MLRFGRKTRFALLLAAAALLALPAAGGFSRAAGAEAFCGGAFCAGAELFPAESRRPSILSQTGPTPAPTASPAVRPGDTTPPPVRTRAPEQGGGTYQFAGEDHFRADGEPAEVVSADRTHDFFEYRTDTLDITIDYYEYDPDGARIVYYVADIYLRGGEEPFSVTPDNKTNGRAQKRARFLAHDAQTALMLTGDGLLTERSRGRGVLIRGGTIYSERQDAPYAALLPGGELRIYGPGEASAQELLALGVRDTYSCGPVLVRSGAADATAAAADASDKTRARLCLGMAAKGHLVALVSDGQPGRYGRGVPFAALADILMAYGCTDAYVLSVDRYPSMLFMGENVNGVIYKSGGKRVNVSARAAAADGLCFGKTSLVPADYRRGFVDERPREGNE